MQNSRVIRKFERFLFKGIPEQPEPTWERDDNTYVEMRQTGKAQASSENTEISCESKVVGEFFYDYEKQTEKYVSNI